MRKNVLLINVRRMALALVCFIIVGNVFGADNPGAVVARLVSKDGTLLARTMPGQDWRTVSEKGELHADDLLVGLPGAALESGNGAVELTLLTDLDKNSPYPIVEAAVVLHASADYDLDFTLDRGRVDVINRKAKGSVRVRIRFHNQQWEATLAEPGTRIALELYGRWPRGVPFRVKPGPKDVPVASLLLLVRKGRVELQHGSCYHVLSAPPGPALLQWDNHEATEAAPQRLEKLPAWAATEESQSETAQGIKKRVEKLRQKIVESSPREAARAFVKSDDPNERAAGVITMGALDDLEGLSDVFTATKHPDTWDRAVVVVRHWLGRRPGQDQILYQRLIDKRGYKPAQAAGIMQLLHSFGDAELAQPELYTTLARYLTSDLLGIRGLAYWHLVRLVPVGKDIGYSPLDPKDKRDKAAEQWRNRIDELIAKGELPPKERSK